MIQRQHQTLDIIFLATPTPPFGRFVSGTRARQLDVHLSFTHSSMSNVLYSRSSRRCVGAVARGCWASVLQSALPTTLMSRPLFWPQGVPPSQSSQNMKLSSWLSRWMDGERDSPPPGTRRLARTQTRARNRQTEATRPFYVSSADSSL